MAYRWQSTVDFPDTNEGGVRCVQARDTRAYTMIMVDELRHWPTSIACFKAGSCHLTTDADDLAELHAFAQRIGLRRPWFQEHHLAPHYDLTASKRILALAAGAVFVSARHQAIQRRGRRARA